MVLIDEVFEGFTTPVCYQSYQHFTLINYDSRGLNYEGKMFISPDLVVIGGDSRSKGCGIKSRYRILDGHFFTYICCKNL